MSEKLSDQVEQAPRALDDAITPISGAHSVPHTARPPRLTAALPRRNWQGLWLVLLVVVLFAAALFAFVKWKGPALEGAPQANSAGNQ
ncbi:MAG: hypothetical protein H6839_14190 [Planctomycetes bacterium]|nr:hypothetical protein [Planctomycetota bacterium]